MYYQFLQSFLTTLFLTLLLKNGWPLDPLAVRWKLCLEEEKKDRLLNPLISGWAVQLSMMSATFPCNFFKLIIKLSDPVFEKRWIYPAFVLASVTKRYFLTFLKHLGFFDLQMKHTSSFSPFIFAAASLVTLILLSLSLVHLSSFRWRVFFR